MVGEGISLSRELYQNRHLSQEMSELLMYEKAKIFCLESRLKRRHARITNFLLGTVPKKFSHLTCRLVSCCCWWAMVCFTNTLLMLCSMAYFFAWKRKKKISKFKLLMWTTTTVLTLLRRLNLDSYYISKCTLEESGYAGNCTLSTCTVVMQ